ncbi:WXG100 family type VII secretion target [Catenulispora sp. GP43]|uniref:WXG100 family type VII secretion target n=1 Tax=Catenulispora sp. GP43 TaxID=3156263 RepID=UPI003518FD3E
MLITGLSFAVLIFGMWGLGVLVVRNQSRKLKEAPGPELTEQIGQTAAEVHSIEEFLARAEAMPQGREPEPRPEHVAARDQEKLEALAKRHFPHLEVPHPHLHLVGITGLEKRLLVWVSHHTGLPSPFVLLDKLTGDPDELERAAKAWDAAHAHVQQTVTDLCSAAAALHSGWDDETAERFYPLLADFLAELDTLADNLAKSAETLRGLRGEAALAEGTIAGLINLLVGSLGGFLVEEVLSVGTMTPAVAAQAQVEITWVLKQIAMAAGRLQGIYANTRHVLDSVSGFKGMQHMHNCFQADVVQRIERLVDSE